MTALQTGGTHQAAPNSSGTAPPKLKAPANSADCHIQGPPGYADGTALAQSYVGAAPQRLVWGSDWPHPSAKQPPDDAALFDLLTTWAPDETTRNRILVSNPEALYGFPKSA